MPIDRIHIQNFKSIRDSGDIHIRPINVLIGPNGVGKSNFISFFKLLNRIYERRLQLYVGQHGYADSILYFGRKTSKFLDGSIVFKDNQNRVNNRYDFRLVPDQRDNLVFEEEVGGYNLFYNGWGNESWDFMPLESAGVRESEFPEHGADRFRFLRNYFDQFRVFHFHDTSSNSELKQPAKFRDYDYLREDGSNLPAFLYRISQNHPKRFKLIEHTIRSVAPFFDRFDLKPDAVNSEQIFLQWREKNSDEYFNAHHFSDGTLRFIALTTLLLQPELPHTIIIDEPELGLHPYAINKLGAMMKKASLNAQLIVSTQSVNLLDQFEAEDILVTEREDGQTTFRRLNPESLTQWLEDYSIGQLWGKNILGGTP
jgi:predicted ATPase